MSTAADKRAYLKKKKFITALREGATISSACDQSGVCRTSVYKYRRTDPTFRDDWEDALEEGTELLEAEAYRRAMGWTETITDKNGNVREVEKHSDLLLIFLLKARKPRMYRDRIDVSVTEERRIILELLRVEKDEETGRLVLVDGDVPLLSAGE